MEKLEILEVLNDWNYWNRELPTTFSRDFYDEKISSFIDSDEIVVLKGIRRCGKSTLLLNQIKKLIKSGVDKNRILFVNLEDPRFVNYLGVEFLQKIKDVYMEYLDPKEKPYIFLDEIQNIPYWEKWVNKEYELKLSNIIITGSNSSMLSGEIATSLSGRYIAIEVFALSFREYLHFKQIKIASKLDFVDRKIDINRAFEEYLDFGAFPKVLGYDKNYKKELLNTYKESILLNDIVARYKLKSFDSLEELAAFLLSNSGIIQSTTKIKNSFNISFDMARDYIEYLKNAYMIFEIKKFDYSLRKQNLNEKKYYSADLGLSNLYRVANLKYRGSNIETVVAIELLRRGFDIYYYKTQNALEVDFVVVKDNKIIKLIQVSKTLQNEKTKNRELAVFQKTVDELKLEDIECVVISEDKSTKIDDGNLNIEIVNILEWLVL